jgi:hypothetical protein
MFGGNACARTEERKAEKVNNTGRRAAVLTLLFTLEVGVWGPLISPVSGNRGSEKIFQKKGKSFQSAIRATTGSLASALKRSKEATMPA